MPRKSLSAAMQADPGPSTSREETSRSSRKSRPSLAAAHSSPDPLAVSPELARSSRKRGRRDADEQETVPAEIEVKTDLQGEEGHVAGGNEEFTLEQQLEAWQEFAAEHYEMVEQLPLELHRNFRLLRELDDGCMGGYS
jgi:hypothetical protein